MVITDFYQSIKLPMIFAHRGANSFAPENSIPAFEQALQLGCDGIEMDLRFTASGDIVVFHDRSLHRMTGKRGRIHHLSLKEIRNFYLEGNPRYIIPTLQEALEVIREKAYIILDIKKESFISSRFEEKICKILKDFKLKDNIIISSFNPLVLKKIAALSPSLHLGFIFRNRSHTFITNGTPIQSFHARHRALSTKYVSDLHARGFRIFAWTVDKTTHMLKAIRKGVDGIITNKPELFYQFLQQEIDSRITGVLHSM